MVSAKSCPCGNKRWVMLLGPDHAHAGLCMPGDCPLRNTLRPSNLCVPIALCTDAQQDEVPSSRTQASQETADQLASPPSLNATQWSMPSYSPISAVATGPTPPSFTLESGKDAVSLLASVEGDISDHEDGASSFSLFPEGARPPGHPWQTSSMWWLSKRPSHLTLPAQMLPQLPALASCSEPV